MTEAAGHRRLTYSCSAADEDAFTGALWAEGAVGCQIEPEPAAAERLRVVAWFPVDCTVAIDLEAWPGAELVADEIELPRDWLAEYRARAVPFDLGRRFRIDPRDPDESEALDQAAAGDDGRWVLRIPARMAFGTGSHETTRLCVGWLEDLAAEPDFDDLRILDVGTGSGILALCARQLGARRVVAFDIDPVSVIVAHHTAHLNGSETFGDLTYLAASHECLAPASAAAQGFDLMLINVLPERILHAYPDLVARLRPGGRIVSSGNLVSRRDELLGRFAAMGLGLVERPNAERRDGEWTSFLLERRP